MKGIKKYVPIVLLVTSLGLGFNIGCKQKQETLKEEPKIEQTTKEEPRIEQTIKEEYIETHVIGNKEYHFGEKFYTEHDDKSFNIASKVKILNTDTKEAKEFYVGYQCDTDIEGKFYKDALSITEKSNDFDYDRIVIQADRDSSGELKVDLVSVFRSGNLHDYFKEGHPRKDIYFKFGKEKLQLYGKLFNIEEERKQAKGKNLHHTLKEFDLSKLTIDDFKYDIVQDGLTATKNSLEVYARTDEYFTFVHMYADQPKEAVSSKRYRMNIITFNPKKLDQRELSVSLGNTEFKLKDSKLRYIKDLYTEDQAKEIIKDATEKMAFIKNVFAQTVPKEKPKVDNRILEKFE